MLSFSLFAFLIKGIPESLLVVAIVFFITRTKFNRIRYVLICLVNILCTAVIRNLPISLGISSLLAFIVLIVFMVTLMHADLIRTIIATIIIAVIITICEIFNMLYLYGLYGKVKATAIMDPANKLLDPFYKSVGQIPSTIFLTLFAIMIFYIMKTLDKKRQEKKDNNAEISTEISE